VILHNIVEFYTQWFRVCLDITTVSLPYLKPLSNNTTIQIKLVRMSTMFHSTKLHLSQGNSSLVVSIIKIIKFKFHRLFTFVFIVISKQIVIKSCPYFKLYQYTKFHGSTLTGENFPSISEIWTSAFWMVECTEL
jgi:hypothetical protein